jgi:hypothetical protein
MEGLAMQIVIRCCWKDKVIRFGSVDLLLSEVDKVKLRIKNLSLKVNYKKPRNADLIISYPACGGDVLINSSYGIELLEILNFIDAHKFSQEEVRNLYLTCYGGKGAPKCLPPPALR